MHSFPQNYDKVIEEEFIEMENNLEENQQKGNKVNRIPLRKANKRLTNLTDIEVDSNEGEIYLCWVIMW